MEKKKKFFQKWWPTGCLDTHLGKSLLPSRGGGGNRTRRACRGEGNGKREKSGSCRGLSSLFLFPSIRGDELSLKIYHGSHKIFVEFHEFPGLIFLVVKCVLQSQFFGRLIKS